MIVLAARRLLSSTIHASIVSSKLNSGLACHSNGITAIWPVPRRPILLTCSCSKSCCRRRAYYCSVLIETGNG
jgi:hypothetical protein